MDQEPIAVTKTKKHEDVFGWLLEAHGGGVFSAASDLFQKATALLERLADRRTPEA